MRASLATLILATTALFSSPAAAEISDGAVRILVLNDQSSVYSEPGGKGSVAAARLAMEDFAAEGGGLSVELLEADHQNKADIGVGVAREMFERKGADAVFDISNSAVSLAVQEIARDKDKVVVHVGSTIADLYGKRCTATSAMWLYDTYALAQGLTRAVVAENGKSWFFVAVDYAFGHSMVEQVQAVLGEVGGSDLGAVYHPVGNADFASFLLQAQQSGAQVIGIANAAGDTANTLKQAAEFGLRAAGQTLAAFVFYLPSAKALGAEAGQGLRFMTGFYWDRDDASRAFARRFAERMAGAMPSQVHAGTYSAVLHYLRAVKASGSDAGAVAMAKMKDLPVEDVFAGRTRLRADGRLMNDMYLVEIKKPAEVSQPWDLLKIIRTMPAEEIIRPLDKGDCPLVKS